MGTVGGDSVREGYPLYQEETPGEFWCASRWDTPPIDRMWNLLSIKELFRTQVNSDNLDFTNTPFEHCRNLYCSRGPQPELEILARIERIVWGGNYVAIVPFKTPNPKGYQGVLMSFNLPRARGRFH